MIDVTNLEKSFIQGSKKIEVLKNINMSINKGETMAIEGSSGSGKTTLLSLLCGLDSPDSGNIKIGDYILNQMTQKDLTKYRAKELGIIFQKFHLFGHLNALENVSLVLELQGLTNANELAKNCLDQVGLSHRFTHLPSQLSGGECQRVGLARAMVTDPSVIFADEPSGSLDEKTGDTVMQLLFDLVEKKKTTLVLVTHNKALADQCMRKVQLTKGMLN